MEGNNDDQHTAACPQSSPRSQASEPQIAPSTSVVPALALPAASSLVVGPQAPAQPGTAIMPTLVMTSNVDTTAIGQELTNLRLLLQIARGKKKEARLELKRMSREHMVELEKKEKQNRKAVSSLEKKIGEYRREIDNYKRQIEGLKEANERIGTDLQDVKERLDRIERQGLKKTHKLLLGTLVYTYRYAAVEYVFTDLRGWDLYRKQREITTLEHLEEELRSDDDRQRLDKFKDKFWKSEYDDTMKRLTDDRLGLAHPTAEREDELPPTPARMEEIIKSIYPKNPVRGTAIELVHSLDQLRREMNKPHLFDE